MAVLPAAPASFSCLHKRRPVSKSNIQGPVFDAEGHYIAYNYTDGTHDWYTYDSSWRLVAFEGRDGKKTLYVYNADGTIKAIPSSAKSK
jgi:YD repeat-containing protein